MDLTLCSIYMYLHDLPYRVGAYIKDVSELFYKC